MLEILFQNENNVYIQVHPTFEYHYLPIYSFYLSIGVYTDGFVNVDESPFVSIFSDAINPH